MEPRQANRRGLPGTGRMPMTLRIRLPAVALAAATMLVACGGGVENTATTANLGVPGAPPPPPRQPPPDQPPPPRQSPPDQPQSVTVSLQTVTDGETASRIATYLHSHASGGPWEGAGGPYSHPPGMVRFASPPTVHIAAGATRRERAITRYVVALVNRALPYGQHLRIGPDVPAGRAHQWQQRLPYIPDGQIFVEWHRKSAEGRASPAVAHQDAPEVYDDRQGRWEKKRLRASAVEMDSDYFDTRPEYEAVSVMVHELVHALGLQGHVPCGSYSDSNMCNAWFRLDGSLPAIDAAGLQVLYTRLGQDTEPEDLSITSLGPWSRQAVTLSGRLDAGGALTFGVRHANGITEPWTRGAEPNVAALRDNRALSGSASWRGELVGFTPALRSVRGKAEIGVNLTTMNGTAAFTDLQSWAAGQLPGNIGSGTQWGDGDLHYSIAVGGNYLHSTGGDAGTVNGRFLGSHHEGVAGSVERADLTAAFGAQRQ